MTFLARWGCWWPFSLWMEIAARAHEQKTWKHFYSRKQSSSWMLGEWMWPFEREGFWRYTTTCAGSRWVWDMSSPVWKRIRDSTCFHCLSITSPVSLFLPLISKTYRAWCWEIDDLVKCIPCNHKGLGLTPTTQVISWVWWSKLIIPALGRWSVPVLLGVPDQWKSLFQEKLARNWQHQRLSFGLCWWVCTYTPSNLKTTILSLITCCFYS